MANNNKLPLLPDLATPALIYQNVRSAGPRKNKAVHKSLIKNLTVIDEQDAVNSFQWFNIPAGMDDALIERMLYYRFSVALFYMKSLDRFFVLPYVGKGIDVFGRYLTISPMPFNGSMESKKETVWIPGLEFTVVHDVKDVEELKAQDLDNSAVILTDYTIGLAQKETPRSALQRPIIEMEAELLPFARTALMNGTGIQGIKVENADEAANVAASAEAIEMAALEGSYAIPIQGGIQMETLTKGAPVRVEDYLLALQSVDNLRLSMHGLDSGGLFQKKAHMLQSEEEGNSGMTGLILQDRLKCRQKFCNIVNSIWGIGLWCDISEPAIGADMNGDGLAKEDETGEPGEGSQDEGGVEE